MNTDSLDVDVGAILACLEEMSDVLQSHCGQDTRLAYSTLLYFFVQASATVGLDKERLLYIVAQAMDARDMAEEAGNLFMNGDGEKWVN